MHEREGRLSLNRLAILLVGLSLSDGCHTLPQWLRGGGERGRAHEAVDGTASSAGEAPALRSDFAPSDDVRVVDVAFDVVQVEMAIEAGRHSRKIWNHVDELRGGSEIAATLARNGFRVGVASSGAWPAIRAVLDAAGARVRREQLTAQPGLPLLIHLGAIDDAESIFSYSDQGRLVGRTFPAGDKLLSIDYAVHPELGGFTELRLDFEIRRDRGTMTWQRQGDIIRQVPDYDRHQFAEVGAALTLHADEFVVIGAHHEAENGYLVGNRFLVAERSGQRSETVLFVTPRPYQARGVKRPPS